ncbi:MAG: hypothetical protein ACM31L_00700 [Actinomycetota bacterium]
MRPTRLLAVFLAAAALAGCVRGEAFVDRAYDATVQKPKPAGWNGLVSVCYTNETPAAERERLAAEACADWGLRPLLYSVQTYQCRLTVPHLAVYRCIDPAMRFANGSYVNPFSRNDVEAWQDEKAGKPRKGYKPADAATAIPGPPEAVVDPMATRGFDPSLR